MGCHGAAPDAPVVAGAHAHNDYEHARPLLDALDARFCSIEADVHLVNGDLLVAHDRKHVSPGRTLRSLYLDPLYDRVRANGGRVYHNGPTVLLFVDLKADGPASYAELKRELEPYRPMLSHFTKAGDTPGAVTIVLTGNVPRNIVASETDRWVACDGGPADVTGSAPVDLVPVVSLHWTDFFKWTGEGDMPPAEFQRLAEMARSAHGRGRRIRFWGGPDNENMWRTLRRAGVDLINTDRLQACRRFLLASK